MTLIPRILEDLIQINVEKIEKRCERNVIIKKKNQKHFFKFFLTT